MNHALRVVMPFVLAASLSVPPGAKSAEPSPASNWPAAWREAWSDPPAELRPLQIVHGLPPNQATPAAMNGLKKLGLGGIVANVNFADYMVSEAHWATLIKAVDACRQVGLIVWLYDEQGYPSGAAGGLVLKTDPAFEALALTFEASRDEPLALRRAYEHTHASNNFYAARRYPNLLDADATRCFIEKTHQAYWRRLEPHFGKTIRAIFTDEPSLMAVNIGQLPQPVRKNVRVADPLDENVEPLPSVPWSSDLPAQYRQRYGQDIMPVRRSLFVGDTGADRLVRRQFWALVADLIAERYFGQIQEWCHRHHIASSGHTLWEETVLHHVPLEGNALKVLARMDIPGLDMLSSDPEAVVHNGWLTASLPASAALLTGGRRVMTEVSDFSQTMAKRPPASLAQMQATAAWQASFGVTEFTLYYNRNQRQPEDYRAYCDFVGRLNALLRDARPNPNVLLYYPIYDLWSEYRPIADRLTLESQSPRAQKIVNSFLELGRRLATAQVSFALIDHEHLATARVSDGRLWIAGQGFDALILPAGVELPDKPADVVNRFKAIKAGAARTRVLSERLDADQLAGLRTSGQIHPASDRLILGRFVRDSRHLLLLVNVGVEPYRGTISVNHAPRWLTADPATGKTEPAHADGARTIRVSLPGRSAILLLGPPITSVQP